MADPKIRRIFKEAADIAKGMPQGLQEAAFNRALDVLLGNDRPKRGSEDGGETNEPEDIERDRLLGIPGAGMLLDTSVAAFNLAANRLGIAELDAGELADVIEDTLGPHVRHSVVGRAFEGADNVVETARSGASAVLRMFNGATDEDNGGDDDEDDEGDSSAPKRKSAASKKRRSGKKSAAARKPTSKKKPKQEKRQPASRSVTATVLGLVTKGFFGSARTAVQVAYYLNRKGIEITVRELTPVLMRLIQDGLLSRSRGTGGQYVYERA